MKVVYVAGRFRAPDHWQIAEHIRAAERVALSAWRAGFAVICPHANTAHFQGAAADSVWLEGDLELLRRCDAVLLVPDWELSVGARAEVEFAVDHGIPVFRDLSLLRLWADTMGG